MKPVKSRITIPESSAKCQFVHVFEYAFLKTIPKKEKNGTNIEIKLKIEEEKDPELKDETKILSNQEKSPNSTDEGIVEKIHEIKQKQKEIKDAKESIINELDEKTSSIIDDDNNKGLQINTEKEELTKTATRDVTKDRIVDKIKEMKSKEVEVKEAVANFIDTATASTNKTTMSSNSKI